MAAFPRAQIDHLLEVAATSTSPQIRGQALEDTVHAMFSSIPGIFPPNRNVVDFAEAGEIDLLFPNRAEREGLWFMPVAVLCECKNWIHPVGSEEVRVLVDRLKERSCTAGILIAASGITGDAADLTSAHRHIARALEAGIHVIVLTREDLLCVRSRAALIGLLLQKWMRLKSFLTSI